ncbi:MAG: hypothetical protein ACI3ZP_06395 [Candidatus Cryptobacteroides sp.]
MNNEIHNVVVPGEEIIFGAAASFENGDQKTKTEYGEPDTEKGYVPLKWLTTDQIEIACPEAVNAQQATYQVSETITNDENNGNSSSAKLMRTSEKGLQWSAEETHHFYAMYPASSMFSDSERGSIGMGEDGVTGYMPVNQNPLKIVNAAGTELTTDNNTGESNWIVNPDMRYAYMVAKNEYTTASEGNVTLTFKPIVTALEFDVTCPEIGAQDNGGEQAIYITALSLHSSSNTNICGAFKYQFNQTAGEYDENDGILTDANTGTGYDRITMSMPNDGVKMANGNKLDVTFFLLPTADFAGGDLKLDIFYTLNGSPFVKTATIGKEILAKKKYFFSNLVLPAIAGDVKGSSWFSALDPNTLISQLSIPVAGNAFSSYYSGTDSQYYKEQTLHYTDLWDKGVRGFEFCTAIGGADGSTSGTLKDNYFVCNGQAMKVNASDDTPVTFGNAFARLAQQLENPDYQNECLIIIATYKSYSGDGGYSPQQYINDLEAFISDNVDDSKLVKLSPSSAVRDLRGKIAILVRPGDDAYESTQNLNVTNSKITLIKDWGTAVDKWDKRFGPEYKSEGAFNNTTASKTIEDYLWGVGSSTGSYSNSAYGPDFQSGYPTVDNFVFNHNTNESGQIVHVQEWARMIPENSFATSKFYSGLSASHFHITYLWLQWPESYSQKQRMIESTVVSSMATKGGSTDNKIFINSLCGFYPVLSLNTSYYPYNTKYQYDCQGSHWVSYSPSFSLDNAGSGGDYVTCAYDLNKWFYEWLTENEDKQQGPVGLVMLNHIGNTSGGSDDKSLDLVNWILMNNFKFPLATKQDPATANYDNEIADGGNAIDFN